jgi:hypothetical protein
MRALLPCLALFILGVRGFGAPEGPPEGLRVMMLPTIQYAAGDIWTKTPNGRGPQFAAVGQVVRGQAVNILVSAYGFALGADGQAEVNYRVLCIRPDGTPGSSTGTMKLIPRHAGGDPRSIHLAPEQAVFSFGPDDPLGAWQVVAEATDAITGITVRIEKPLIICGDKLLQEPLPPGTDPGRWLMGYHNKPVPQQLLAALKNAAEHPPAKAKPTRDAENGTWLGFFEQVLTDNPWLLPHLVARLAQARDRERELLATSLAYAKRDDVSFFKTLPNPAREAFMPHRLQAWPIPTAEQLNGAQLDVLWGRFFASGHYAPIRELVAVLAYYPYKDALDEFRNLEKKPPRPPVEVQKSIVFGAAAWSLRSNIQQDKVVRDYCEGMLLRKELPEALRPWLAGIFQAAVKDIPKSNAAR